MTDNTLIATTLHFIPKWYSQLKRLTITHVPNCIIYGHAGTGRRTRLIDLTRYWFELDMYPIRRNMEMTVDYVSRDGTIRKKFEFSYVNTAYYIEYDAYNNRANEIEIIYSVIKDYCTSVSLSVHPKVIIIHNAHSLSKRAQRIICYYTERYATVRFILVMKRLENIDMKMQTFFTTFRHPSPTYDHIHTIILEYLQTIPDSTYLAEYEEVIMNTIVPYVLKMFNCYRIDYIMAWTRELTTTTSTLLEITRYRPHYLVYETLESYLQFIYSDKWTVSELTRLRGIIQQILQTHIDYIEMQEHLGEMICSSDRLITASHNDDGVVMSDRRIELLQLITKCFPAEHDFHELMYYEGFIWRARAILGTADA